MKKLILFLAIVLMNVAISHSQWKTRHFYDEFKQPTNTVYYYIDAAGHFSNLVTTDGDLICRFILDKVNSALSIYVYEYRENPSVSMESTWEVVKVKTPKGIEVFNKVFFSKHGFLMFVGDNFKRLNAILETPGTYHVKFNRTKDTSVATFLVDITIE